MNPREIRREMRVHIRSSVVSGDMFARALAGGVFSLSGGRHPEARAYVKWDDGTQSAVKIKYLFEGEPPDWMITPDKLAQSKVEGVQPEASE